MLLITAMRFIFTFLIMFTFWIVLSGQFDTFHLSLGVLSSLIVSFISADLLFERKVNKGLIAELWRLFKYTFWLFYQILVANVYVAFLALHPKMKDHLDPTIVTFKSKLTTTLARVIMANSITLTPGTITIRMEDDVYYVHALTRKFAEALPGEMEERLAKVFEDGQ